MAAINSVEASLLPEFRKRFAAEELTDDQSTDLFLIRWIRARNHDLDKAEGMLRQSLKWRKEMDMDNIFSWEPPSDLKELDPAGVIGFDVDNSPVAVCEYGRINFRKIVRSGKQGLFLKYIHSIIEQALAQMQDMKQRDGNPVSQYILIMDMKGFPYKSLTCKGVVDLLLQVSKTIEANHPETLKKFYVINAGTVFPVLLSLIKPILAPATQAKLSVYNKASKWKPVLQENIPLDVLPPAYGGTNTCAESFNETADTMDTEDTEADFLTVTLPSAEKVTMVFDVEEKNNKISWAFRTNKNGVRFSVSNSLGNKVYFQNTKMDSHVKTIEGSLTCETPGGYVFTFGNFDEEQELEYSIDIRSNSGAKQLTFD